MKKDEPNSKQNGREPKEPNPPGYPLYPSKDDIYEQEKIETAIDPDAMNSTEFPAEVDIPGINSDDELNANMPGSDLDIPGAELDDAQEIIGNEDEENNYYSLGGDNHNDLEEDQGD